MKKKTTVFYYFICILIICIFTIPKISYIIGPVIIPDEIGHWGAAAVFSNVDWSGSMKISPYYGYGYGLIFSWLFKLIDEPVLMFKIALYINIFMLCIIFFLSLFITKKLYPSLALPFTCAVALAVTLYPYNIYYCMVTGSEVLQVLSYLCLCALFLCLCNKKHQNIQLCLLAFVSIFLIACHQRNLGILCALFFTIIFMFVSKKIKFSSLLIYLLSTLIGLFVFMYLKNIINQNLYGVLQYTTEEASKISGALGIFSVAGIKSFIKLFLGRLFYLGCASFLIFYYGVFDILKEVIFNIKNTGLFSLDSLNYTYYFKFFLILTTIFEISIGSLAFLGNSKRIDGFLYGRYNEHIIIPILIVGLLFIIKKANNSKITLLIITNFTFIVSLILRYVFFTNQTYETSTHSISSIIGIPFLKNYSIDNIQFLFSIALAIFALTIFHIIYLLLKKHTIYRFFIGISILCICWMFMSSNAIQWYIIDFQEYNEDLYTFSKEVMNNVNQDEIIYQMLDMKTEHLEPTSSTWLIYRIRFFLKEQPINVIDLSEFDNQSYIMVYKYSTEYSFLKEQNYISLVEGKRMCLFKKVLYLAD